jgi:hypothetical protein
MASQNRQPHPNNSLAKAIRDVAANQSDPAEVESLLRSAALVEQADVQLRQSHDDLLAAIARANATAEAIRKQDHLPIWVVVTVLLLWVAVLAYAAVKHNV